MRLLYFFDEKIKPLTMCGKYYCKPEETGVLQEGISCIREYDVNFWFYSKDGKTLAFDSGHLNYKGIDEEFKKIDIMPEDIKHLFLTHLDTDHAGGIDKSGRNIFPNAKVYMGEEENKYMMREIRRKGFFFNCVQIAEGWIPIKGNTTFEVEGIKVEAIPVPGHTIGHTVYIVDDKIMISGDCLAINEDGGYAFFLIFSHKIQAEIKSLYANLSVNWRGVSCYMFVQVTAAFMLIQKKFLHILTKAQCSVRERPFRRMGNIILLRRNNI